MEQTKRTLKLVVRYDGTEFAGWQVQPGQRTVQGDLEEALSRIVGESIAVIGAGRTDSGVHALGQVCSCSWPVGRPIDTLQRSVSSMLSPAVRIESVEEAPAEFHARYSAKAKRYAYTFSLSRTPDPFSARYAWHLRGAIDRDALAALLPRLVGEHDFAGFQCAGASVQSTVRELFALELREGGMVGPNDAHDLWHLYFHGNGFLYKMVRNLTGTLIDIARGHVPESILDERLNEPGPYRGYTAPAHGLMLVGVDYD